MSNFWGAVQTSFFYTPWTFFAQNVAKVYGGSPRPDNLPRNPDEV